MLGGAAPRLAEHPRGVRIVHRHDRVVLTRQRDDVGELRDVAFHGEDAVGEDQLETRAFGGFELLLEIRHVGVLVDGGLAFGDRLGEADGVDDRGVIQLIGDDDVLLAEQGGDEAFVGVPAAHVAE